MCHRGRQGYPAHALAAHFGAGHLDAAPVADHALVPDLLVLAAVALPVLRRTEDPLAEQTVFLGPQRPVVDGLRFCDLTVRPGLNLIGRRQGDTYCVEVVAALGHVAFSCQTLGLPTGWPPVRLRLAVAVSLAVRSNAGLTVFRAPGAILTF